MLPLSYKMKGDLDFSCVQMRHFQAVTVCISQPSEMYNTGHEVDGNNKWAKMNLISKPDNHIIFFYKGVFLKAEMEHCVWTPNVFCAVW